MSIDATATEIRPDRLSRDELELLQARALRSWRDSTWLARERPRDYAAVEAQDPDDIVLDLGGGVGESQQTPGAIVLGETTTTSPLPTGETRAADYAWDDDCCAVPAETGAVDTIVVPEGALRDLGQRPRECLFADIARALTTGGTLILREDIDMTRALRPLILSLGFTEESRRDQRADRDAEITYRLTDKTTRNDEQSTPLIRETVLGDTRPRPLRQTA